MQLANLVVDEINDLIEATRHELLSPDQLREAANSISANIAEAYGGRDGPERLQFFRYADGSAREAQERLRASRSRNRVPPLRYWRVHNRLTLISKMLRRLQRR